MLAVFVEACIHPKAARSPSPKLPADPQSSDRSRNHLKRTRSCSPASQLGRSEKSSASCCHAASDPSHNGSQRDWLGKTLSGGDQLGLTADGGSLGSLQEMLADSDAAQPALTDLFDLLPDISHSALSADGSSGAGILTDTVSQSDDSLCPSLEDLLAELGSEGEDAPTCLPAFQMHPLDLTQLAARLQGHNQPRTGNSQTSAQASQQALPGQSLSQQESLAQQADLAGLGAKPQGRAQPEVDPAEAAELGCHHVIVAQPRLHGHRVLIRRNRQPDASALLSAGQQQPASAGQHQQAPAEM